MCQAIEEWLLEEREGTEFLNDTDTVIFFFSDASGKIVNYRMRDIKNSRCGFEICKLKNVRKNALDFYIATKVGEIFALDGNAQVAIISVDKGYEAVLDYWRARLPVLNQLVRAKNIANAIKIINGEGARKAAVNNSMRILELKAEYAKYEERNRILEELKTALSGTGYEHLVEKMADIVIAADTPKMLYISSLKSLGKKDGTEVYRRIKGKVG